MVSLFSLVAIFFCAILTALLWSYGLQIFTKCIKFILVIIFKIIKLILFGRKKNTEETISEADKSKEKTN